MFESIDFNNSQTINLTSPTKEGYIFTGWTSNVGDIVINGNIDDFAASITGCVTVMCFR